MKLYLLIAAMSIIVISQILTYLLRKTENWDKKIEEAKKLREKLKDKIRNWKS